MLTMLRNATKGWVAKILIFLLVASFAVYGVSASFFADASNSVISVGNTKVGLLDYRLAYDRQINEVSRRLGTRLTRQQAQGFGVEQTVIANLTTGAVLDENSRNMGLGISNDKLASLIGDDENFRDASGNFSRSQLQAVLRNIGMSEAAYVNNRKSVAIRNQLIEGTSNSAEMPDSFFEIVAKSQGEKRIFDYIWLKSVDVTDQPKASSEDLKTYYEANLRNYKAPEYRKVNIVKLEAKDIADEAGVTDEEIAAEYETTKSSFTTVEKRNIEQLVFPDQTKAESALKRMRDGELFETIVSEEGKSAADISLGLLAKSDIPDANVSKAAFSLELNTPSDIVDGIFGSVIVRVTEIQPEVIKPLADVKDQLRKSIAVRLAEDQIFEAHDKFEDERAAGETLEASAKNVGLTVRTLDAIDRTGRDSEGTVVSDLPESRKLINEIFDTDEGTETAPISIGSDGFVWYEVVGITEERQKPQDEVKEDLAKDWILEETNKAIDKIAETIQSRVSSGETLEAVSKDLLAKDTDQEDAPSRVLKSAALLAADTSKDMDAEAIRAGFTDKQGAVVVSNGIEGDGKLVIQIVEIQENNATPITDAVKNQINGNLGNDIMISLVNQLQQKQPVQINRTAISHALNY